MKSVKARLKAIPAVLEAARTSLKNPPRVHTETAILQNKGNVSLVREELKSYLDQVPELIPEFASVQSQVIAALESYGVWLEKELLPKSNGNFRIGENKFRDKLRYTLDSDLSIEEILQRAQSDLQKTQDELYETARSLSKRESGGERCRREKECDQGGSRSTGRVATDERNNRGSGESEPGRKLPNLFDSKDW